MNSLEKLQNQIPKFSQINYTGVLNDMSQDVNFRESIKSKNKNIFVTNPMNVKFVEKYAENSMNSKKQSELAKNKELGEANIMNFLQVIQGGEPINIRLKIKKEYIARFVNSAPFNIIISIIILLNTIFICLQTNEKIYNKMPIAFQLIDSICVSIFTIEIALKFISDPKEFWFSGWNIFDLIIVIFSYISNTLTFITSFRVLRIFRVLKAIRILKSLKSAKKMSIMFEALIKSSKDIGYVILLIIMFLLCASFIALNLFSAYSDFWFGSFTKTLWTLVIFLTNDGWLDPYNDLVDAGQRYIAMVFIFVFIWIGAWILAQSLVGVSTNSIKLANKELKYSENESKKLKKNKNLKNHDENEVKNLVPPPFPYDRSWESQAPLEVPPLNHINPDALVHLYLTISLINKNIDEMDNLIDQYQKKVSEIISQQNATYI